MVNFQVLFEEYILLSQGFLEKERSSSGFPRNISTVSGLSTFRRFLLYPGFRRFLLYPGFPLEISTTVSDFS